MKPTETKDKNARQIILLHSEIEESLNTTLAKAINIGRILVEVRKNLVHGQWLPWVEKNLPFTPQAARNYMKLYSNRELFKNKQCFHLREAYNLILSKNQKEVEPKKAVSPSPDPDFTNAREFNSLSVELLSKMPEVTTALMGLKERDPESRTFQRAVNRMAKLRKEIDRCLKTVDSDHSDNPLRKLFRIEEQEPETIDINYEIVEE